MQCPFRVIVVEGALEVPTVLKILDALNIADNVPPPIDKRGRTAFWDDVWRYNQAATIGPVFGLADLESKPCATAVIRDSLPGGRHPNSVLRLTVRMLESWLLAHTRPLAAFLGVSVALLPRNPDGEQHAKRILVNLARRSKSRHIREDLVPDSDTSAQVGRNYTARMSQFIHEHWGPLEAQENSPSLQRALRALQRVSV